MLPSVWDSRIFSNDETAFLCHQCRGPSIALIESLKICLITGFAEARAPVSSSVDDHVGLNPRGLFFKSYAFP
jgi:hypothetical protein